jgi:hypothetical protein
MVNEDRQSCVTILRHVMCQLLYLGRGLFHCVYAVVVMNSNKRKTVKRE